MLRRLCCLCLTVFSLLTAIPSPSSTVANKPVGAGLVPARVSLNEGGQPLHSLSAASILGERGGALWPGSRFTEQDRERAIMRGLQFIYRTALVRKNFEDYGHDYLWCFYTLSTAVKDERVRREAHRMGLERAHEWRREHHSVPLSADATLISELVFGNDAAESLGLKDEKFKEELKQIAPRFKARSYLLFDPLTEPPPEDVPDMCDYCGAETNSRGSLVCHVCKHRLKMRTRYDVWYDALITTYTGDRTGIPLGAHYVDVLKWLPTLRPYHAKPSAKGVGEFYDIVYAITHIVYTLNNYSQYRLSPQLLPQEFEFLKANLREAIREKDTDMLGEFMDTLRAFGLTTNDSLIRRGMEFYLTHQNADGSWGKRREKDIYLRYHPTWNAIAGLSEYAWVAGEGLSFPEVRPLLEQWANESPKSSIESPLVHTPLLSALDDQTSLLPLVACRPVVAR
ncbi:MAG TPA: hypothetical protein VF779_11760 [Pyrinomonadaceae bacterium]